VPLPASATFHIGPIKTGSTSIQDALADHRADLLGHDVLYPADRPWAPNHMAAVVDLMPRLNDVHPTPAFRATIRGFEPRAAGAWDDLVDQVKCYPGHAIISQETLAFLGRRSVEQLAREFPGVPLRAVVVDRPLHRLVASVYQQEAKFVNVSDFGPFVEQTLREPWPWLDANWVKHAWESAGVETTVITARPDLSAGTLHAAMRAILPHAAPIPPVEAANVSPSADGVDVWRAAAHRHRPHYVGSVVNSLRYLTEHFLWATEPTLGGRYVILDTNSRATERIDGSAPVDHEHVTGLLGRRIRAWDAAYAASDLAHPVLRRPRPIRAY
jgi:hypothetical protein